LSPTREKWLKVLLEKVEPGCEIGMEACAGAHHWARQLQARGFTVKLIAPQVEPAPLESVNFRVRKARELDRELARE
jgi:transposase